jgi:hypothetical protein
MAFCAGIGASMRIAILGWGSLIWDPRGLPRASKWEKGGPELPIEFSRKSSDGRLTLVIDETSGVRVPTQFATSPRIDLAGAICDLCAREGTVIRNIGYIDLMNSDNRCRLQVELNNIQKWTTLNRFDAVVWTDLPPKWKMNEAFCIEKAVEYPKSLRGDQEKKAREYIKKAPCEIDTPLLRKLREDGWLNE